MPITKYRRPLNIESEINDSMSNFNFPKSSILVYITIGLILLISGYHASTSYN